LNFSYKDTNFQGHSQIKNQLYFVDIQIIISMNLIFVMY
jgi:hypothetical protein